MLCERGCIVWGVVLCEGVLRCVRGFVKCERVSAW